jgi:hypothetical protein
MRWEQYDDGLPTHQPDYWGTSLRFLDEYARKHGVSQDELNKILDENFCDIYDIEPPHSRLFPELVDR